jgi:hypothetical protein
MSTKYIYQNLLDRLSEPPHSLTKFTPLYGQLYWKDTWQQVFIMPLDRKTRDLSWKLAHGKLLTADRLLGWGLRVSTDCFCSTAPESIPHLFFACPFIQGLLVWALSLFLRVALTAPSFEVRHLLFGYNAWERRCVPPVCSYLLNLIKFFVWRERNDYRFNQVIPDQRLIQAKVCARLNLHLKVFAKRHISPLQRRCFKHSWNVLGKFAPNIRVIPGF